MMSETCHLSPVRFAGPRSFVRAGSRPGDRPGLVYPIYFDKNRYIIGTGRTHAQRRDAGELAADTDSLNTWRPPQELTGLFDIHSVDLSHISEEDVPPSSTAYIAWPWHEAGGLAPWAVKPDTLRERQEKRALKVNWNKGQPTLYYLSRRQLQQLAAGELIEEHQEAFAGPIKIAPKLQRKRPMTVWHRKRHDAGRHGTTLLKQLFGESNSRFDFPKSLYSTLDAISAIIADRPDAVVLDFFAGSGTTLHAVAALNVSDGGRRQCVLVTNNEVSARARKSLEADGCAPGDVEWEARGVFQRVTKPRVEAALTGRTPNGDPVSGKYLPPLYERPIADGLPATATFLRLKCLDPQLLEMRDHCKIFDELHPMLWAASGSYGPCPSTHLPDPPPPWLLPDDHMIPAGCRYGVLLDEAYVERFCHHLADHPTITHVWVNTYSEGSARELRDEIHAAVNGSVRVAQLYYDVFGCFQSLREV